MTTHNFQYTVEERAHVVKVLQGDWLATPEDNVVQDSRTSPLTGGAGSRGSPWLSSENGDVDTLSLV